MHLIFKNVLNGWDLMGLTLWYLLYSNGHVVASCIVALISVFISVIGERKFNRKPN